MESGVNEENPKQISFSYFVKSKSYSIKSEILELK